MLARSLRFAALAGVVGVAMCAATSVAAGPVAHVAQGPDYQLPPTYLTPIPIVRLGGRTNKTGARVTLLRVRAPRGSTVTLKCAGGRGRGCTFRSKKRLVPASRLVRFREIEHRLKAGVRLQVFVRRGDTIGKYTAFTIRKRKPPKRKDACLFPGDPSEPAECP